MASSSDKTAVALADYSTEDHSQFTGFPKDDVHQASNTVRPFLQRALTSLVNTGEVPATLFSPISSSCHNIIRPQGRDVSWPILDAKARNDILLYTGSFNPPHQGHLATILYFHERREQLRITAMIVSADPASVVDGRKKKWADTILPQNLRHELFYRVPEVAELVASGWLQFLGGDMGSHIEVLRATTDLILEAGFDVKLVGLLGGDKLTVESEPHLQPGTLGEWGPVDEFLIINARRPVDFFDLKNEETPRDLPGCTKWLRDWDKFNTLCMSEVRDAPLAATLLSDENQYDENFPENSECQGQQHQIKTEDRFKPTISSMVISTADNLAEDVEESIGILWVCQALTVSGNPIIQFRASQSSASNGVSSTKIRQIMIEAPDEKLVEELKDKVISVEFLVEWIQLQRKQKREFTGELDIL